MNSELSFSEACERNKAAILEALLQVFPCRGRALEIGSGTGQHVVYFAPHFPRLSWQPTEQQENLYSLEARIRQEGGRRVLPPIQLDVRQAWPDHLYDAVFSSNTAHIMPWAEVCRMFAGVGARLRPAGTFCLYGPFNEEGRFTSQSNADFDQGLRQRDPSMGLRDVEALASLAADNGMELHKQVKLPANNQLLVFAVCRDSNK
jgi:cyclopropane fatty-acyl-phospholipid synthase-like methyltransferase